MDYIAHFKFWNEFMKMIETVNAYTEYASIFIISTNDSTRQMADTAQLPTIQVESRELSK